MATSWSCIVPPPLDVRDNKIPATSRDFAASYINYLPISECRHSPRVRRQGGRPLLPDRWARLLYQRGAKVVAVNIDQWRRGGIHCITLHQPA